jgi:hypothetical protein
MRLRNLTLELRDIGGVYGRPARVLHVYRVVRKRGEVGRMRLLAGRGQRLKGIEDMLPSMCNNPVSATQSVITPTPRLRTSAPSLFQLLFHGAVFGLSDRDLETLRLAWAFRIGWRITDGTIRSRIHLFLFTGQPRTSSTIFAVLGLLFGG